MLKLMVEEVALMPTTVPLSINFPLPKVVAEVQIATWPGAPPERASCLLLKVVQSAEIKQPRLVAEESGQLMTKALPVPRVEVEMLKLLPVVPVATFSTIFAGILSTALIPVPKLEVEMLKTSLVAVEVLTLLSRLVGRLMTTALVVVEI